MSSTKNCMDMTWRMKRMLTVKITAGWLVHIAELNNMNLSMSEANEILKQEEATIQQKLLDASQVLIKEAIQDYLMNE